MCRRFNSAPRHQPNCLISNLLPFIAARPVSGSKLPRGYSAGNYAVEWVLRYFRGLRLLSRVRLHRLWQYSALREEFLEDARERVAPAVLKEINGESTWYWYADNSILDYLRRWHDFRRGGFSATDLFSGKLSTRDLLIKHATKGLRPDFPAIGQKRWIDALEDFYVHTQVGMTFMDGQWRMDSKFGISTMR